MINKNNIDNFVIKYLLPIGLTIQLTGLLWLGRTGVGSQTYVWLLAPALLSLVLNIDKKTLLSFDYKCVSLIFLVIFLTWAFISIGWSDGKTTYKKMAIYCASIILYVYSLIRLSEQPKRLEKILLFCAFITVVTAAASLIYHYGLEAQSMKWRQYRIHSLTSYFADFRNPITAALYYGIFGLILFSWQQYSSPLKKSVIITTFFCLAIILIYIIMTGSRGPAIAFIGSAFIILFPKNKKIMYASIAFIVLCIIIMSFKLNLLPQKIFDITFDGRTDIWKANLQIILTKPWIGHGYNSSFAVLNNWGHIVYTPHSYFLQLMRSYGIIGTTFFFIMLIHMVLMSIKYRKQKLVKIATGIYIFSLIGMLTDISIIVGHTSYYWLYIWLPLGVIAGEHFRQRKIKQTAD